MSEDNKFRERLKEAAGLIPKLPKPEIIAPCPKCNGERIEADVLEMRLAPIKNATWSKVVGVDAVVCTACGYTELFTREPLKLVVKRPDRKIEDFGE